MPSGFASSTSQSAVPRGGRARLSRATTARPACSLPWTAPTTSTFTRARGLPDAQRADRPALLGAPDRLPAGRLSGRRTRGRRRGGHAGEEGGQAPRAPSMAAALGSSARDRRACGARRRGRADCNRHGVRVRAPLPGAALPRAGGGARPGRRRRRAHRGARPARGRPRLLPARARARRPGRRGRDARGPPGRGDPAPHAGHRGPQRLRHPGGGGLPRLRQPGGLRVARAQGAEGEAEGQRGLHALGQAAR